jgi:hypothetical protein
VVQECEVGGLYPAVVLPCCGALSFSWCNRKCISRGNTNGSRDVGKMDVARVTDMPGHGLVRHRAQTIETKILKVTGRSVSHHDIASPEQ